MINYNDGPDLSKIYIGHVIGVDKENQKVNIYIPQLMAGIPKEEPKIKNKISKLNIIGYSDYSTKTEVQNYISADILDIDSELPDIDSLIYLMFLDNDISKPICRKINDIKSDSKNIASEISNLGITVSDKNPNNLPKIFYDTKNDIVYKFDGNKYTELIDKKKYDKLYNALYQNVPTINYIDKLPKDTSGYISDSILIIGNSMKEPDFFSRFDDMIAGDIELSNREDGFYYLKKSNILIQKQNDETLIISNAYIVKNNRFIKLNDKYNLNSINSEYEEKVGDSTITQIQDTQEPLILGSYQLNLKNKNNKLELVISTNTDVPKELGKLEFTNTSTNNTETP